MRPQAPTAPRVPSVHMAGQQLPGQQLPGQQLPGQQMPGQPMPGQISGQQMQGQQLTPQQMQAAQHSRFYPDISQQPSQISFPGQGQQVQVVFNSSTFIFIIFWLELLHPIFKRITLIRFVLKRSITPKKTRPPQILNDTDNIPGTTQLSFYTVFHPWLVDISTYLEMRLAEQFLHVFLKGLKNTNHKADRMTNCISLQQGATWTSGRNIHKHVYSS